MTTDIQSKIREMYLARTPISVISKTLSISRQYVYDYLIKSGLYRNKRQQQNTTSLQGLKGVYRLHACHFIIHIISKGSRFYKLQGNKGMVDGHTYTICPNDTIQLYQSKGEQHPSSIYGTTLNDMANNANEYWNSIFIRLQRRIDCLLLKDGYPSIEDARSHIAYVDDSGMVKEITTQLGSGIYIYNKDGKAWFYFDLSHGNPEREYIEGHNKNILAAQRLEPFFNDLLQKQWYTPSVQKGMIDNILNTQQEYATAIKEHLAAIRSLAHEVKGLRQGLKHDIVKELRTKQKRIGDY